MSAVFERIRSEGDRRAFYTIASRAFHTSLSLRYAVALRLRWERFRIAEHWGVRVNGEIVGGLVSYPLCFGTPAGPVAGAGLGTVCIRPDLQGRGLASALCARVVEGAPLALLFSEVKPSIYERIGFGVAPAPAWACTRPAELAVSGPAVDLVPIDPLAHGDALLRTYAAAHRGLHLARDEAWWRRLMYLEPADVFLAVGGDPARGYVRALDDDGRLEVVELCLAEAADEPGVLRALAALCSELGHDELYGWLDDSDTVRSWFEPRSRARTLPMVKGVVDLAGSRFWSSDYF